MASHDCIVALTFFKRKSDRLPAVTKYYKHRLLGCCCLETAINANLNVQGSLLEPRKFYTRRINNKVDSIETGRIVIAHLLP